MAEQQRDSVETKKKLRLTITTPRGIKFQERADMVIMRLIDGDMGVLPGHEPISAVLGDGILHIINDNWEAKLAVFGGLVEVNNQEVNIFTTIAQLPGEIDEDRAEEDRRRAAEALEIEEPDLQVQYAKVLIRRALLRLEVSQFGDKDEADEVQIKLQDIQTRRKDSDSNI